MSLTPKRRRYSYYRDGLLPEIGSLIKVYEDGRSRFGIMGVVEGIEDERPAGPRVWIRYPSFDHVPDCQRFDLFPRAEWEVV